MAAYLIFPFVCLFSAWFSSSWLLLRVTAELLWNMREGVVSTLLCTAKAAVAVLSGTHA